MLSLGAWGSLGIPAWNVLTWMPAGPHRPVQPMEENPETLRAPTPPPRPCSPMPTGRSPPVLLLPGRLACSLLEAANHSLTMGAAGPLPPSPLPAVRFGHQAATDVAFTILLPLTLTWTRSGWALVGTFCHLDPSLASLTFYASSRLLTRTAADCWASPL